MMFIKDTKEDRATRMDMRVRRWKVRWLKVRGEEVVEEAQPQAPHFKAEMDVKLIDKIRSVS
jgi:hypothetical protein